MVIFILVDIILIFYFDCMVVLWKIFGVVGFFVFCGFFREGIFFFVSIYVKKVVFFFD